MANGRKYNHMKNCIYILILILISISFQGFSQDFDQYLKHKNDNFSFPEIPDSLTYEEFQILSRDIRMMDMAYSAIVPGYVHFKAKEERTGYYLLGARLIGYTGLSASYLNLQTNGLSLSDIFDSNDLYNAEKALFISSITIIVSSYLFDWIHGKMQLETKQEDIRFKYSLRVNMEPVSIPHEGESLVTGLSLGVTF